MSPIKLFDENKSLLGFNLRHLMHQQNCSTYVGKIFQTVVDMWKQGKVKPVVDSTWAIEDVSTIGTFGIVNCIKPACHGETINLIEAKFHL